jgi:hypothetical protein
MLKSPNRSRLRGLAAFMAGEPVRVTVKGCVVHRVRLCRHGAVSYLQVMTARGRVLSQPIVDDAVSEFLKLARGRD